MDGSYSYFVIQLEDRQEITSIPMSTMFQRKIGYVTQCVTIPKMLNDTNTALFPIPNIFDTDTGTFFSTKFFRYRFRDFFPILIFTDTGSETFLRYQIFPIPVPIPPEKGKIPSTGTYTIPVPIINLQNS